MARKAQLTASLPKLAVSEEMRRRVQAVADVAEVSMADVARDCIEAQLGTLELQLGLVTLDDLEDHALAALGLVRNEEPDEPVKEDRAANCWGR